MKRLWSWFRKEREPTVTISLDAANCFAIGIRTLAAVHHKMDLTPNQKILLTIPMVQLAAMTDELLKHPEVKQR